VEVQKKPRRPIISRPEGCYARVARSFTLRHIFAHELAERIHVDRVEIQHLLDGAEEFIHASAECISEVLSPGRPLTQADMTQQAVDRYSAEVQAMHGVIAELTQALEGKQAELLKASQMTWEAHATAHAQLLASKYEGGSMRPQLYFMAGADMVRARTGALRQTQDYLLNP